MIIVIIFISAIFALITWNILNNHVEIEIPESDNISYDSSVIQNLSASDVITFIENNERNSNPVLIYLYTSWCGICKKQLPEINAIANKFQNTDLKILAIAIDKDGDKGNIIEHLERINNLYFKPFYIGNRSNFKESLQTKSIKFNNKIPFLILIDRNSDIINQSSGYKKFKYLNRKVMKLLAKKDAN